MKNIITIMTLSLITSSYAEVINWNTYSSWDKSNEKPTLESIKKGHTFKNIKKSKQALIIKANPVVLDKEVPEEKSTLEFNGKQLVLHPKQKVKFDFGATSRGKYKWTFEAGKEDANAKFFIKKGSIIEVKGEKVNEKDRPTILGKTLYNTNYRTKVNRIVNKTSPLKLPAGSKVSMIGEFGGIFKLDNTSNGPITITIDLIKLKPSLR